MYYVLIKLSSVHEVGEVNRNQTLARQCYLMSHQVKPSGAFHVEGLDTKDKLFKERGEPTKDLVTIPLGDEVPWHIVWIKSKLDEATRQ